MLNFEIKGDFRVGGEIYATGNYIGGVQGASEYWWVRIASDGTRNNDFTSPKPILTAVLAFEFILFFTTLPKTKLSMYV